MKKHKFQGPDFICIGAQKAGTTWLYDQLIHHPQVWLPVIKELHYFNFEKPNPQLLGIEGYPWGGPFQRMRFLRHRPTAVTFLWLLRYNFFKKGPDWYLKLFPMKNGRISGEMTPAYSTLDEFGIKFVRDTVSRHCRIFVILRDPVERAWSALKMNYRWRMESLPDDIERLKKELLSPSNRLRSAYSEFLPIWERYFGKHFKVFFYDHLVEDSASFLYTVCEYLKIDTNWQSPVLNSKPNADVEKIKIPMALYNVLFDVVKDDINYIRNKYGNKCSGW